MQSAVKLCVLLGAVSVSPVAAQPWSTFADLPIWDDGLSEMCYYDASDEIYGQPRNYTRVHLLNRQWMSAASGVKCRSGDPDAVPVFKLNIAEQIPTENYNYRYLTTVFLRRPELVPFKMVTSSQEWCGATFKHLRWTDGELVVQSFSYFPAEGDRSWTLAGSPLPLEAVGVVARACAVTGETRAIEVLPALRGSHEVTPVARSARLVPAADTRRLRTTAGTFTVRQVELWFDKSTSASYGIATEPPYLLVSFNVGGVRGVLRGVERRPYWERSSNSGFHEPTKAP